MQKEINGFILSEKFFSENKSFHKGYYASFEEMISDEAHKGIFRWHDQEPSCYLSIFRTEQGPCYCLNFSMPYYGYAAILCKSYAEYKENVLKIAETIALDGTTVVFSDEFEEIKLFRPIKKEEKAKEEE